MRRFFLVDCNNFYVSCERVFNPTLHKKPVVVLGSNDACVIARSNEAKALGIPMGAPAFECASLFKKHNVIVYSANFALYGDMSNRVMQILAEFSTDIEIYSVDEAFLFISRHSTPYAVPDMPHSEKNHYLNYAYFLRKEVQQRTGIPVSIGIGPTKTLAKVAHKLAKKNPPYNGAFDITDHPALDTLLESIDIGDVWGIGSRYARLLQSKKIFNARQFKYMDDRWVRKHMTIGGLKTLLELRGTSCLPLEDCPEPKQSISVSRLFGKKITNIQYAKEALASYTACAAEKLRAQNSLASHITVFVLTSRYHEPQNYFWSTGCILPVASSYTPHLITAAYKCLEELFKPGLLYKKVGVLLSDLVPADSMQMNIAINDAPVTTNKQNSIIKAVDKLNTRWGRNTVFFAAAGTAQPWKMHQAQKSACYTTNWHELLTIQLNS